MSFNQFISTLERGSDNQFEGAIGVTKAEFQVLLGEFRKGRDGTKKLAEDKKLYAILIIKRWGLDAATIGQIVLESSSNFKRDGETFFSNVNPRLEVALNTVNGLKQKVDGIARGVTGIVSFQNIVATPPLTPVPSTPPAVTTQSAVAHFLRDQKSVIVAQLLAHDNIFVRNLVATEIRAHFIAGDLPLSIQSDETYRILRDQYESLQKNSRKNSEKFLFSLFIFPAFFSFFQKYKDGSLSNAAFKRLSVTVLLLRSYFLFLRDSPRPKARDFEHRLLLWCKRPDIYRSFINHYFTEGVLGIRPCHLRGSDTGIIDAIAWVNQWPLYVWRMTAEGNKELMYRNDQSGNPPVHLCYEENQREYHFAENSGPMRLLSESPIDIQRWIGQPHVLSDDLRRLQVSSTPEKTKYDANVTAALKTSPDPDSIGEIGADKFVSVHNITVYEHIQKLKEFIREHAARRVDCAFYTLIAYYGLGKRVDLDLDPEQKQHGKGKKGDSSTNACHSAHVSAFVEFNDEGEQNGRQTRSMGSTEETRLLSGTFFYETLNATVELPTEVNNLDRMIEGQNGSPSVVRGKFIELINRVSKKELTPIEALRRYLEFMQESFFSGEADNYKKALGKRSQGEKKNLVLAFTYEKEGTPKTVSDDYIAALLRLTPHEKAIIIADRTDDQRYANAVYEVAYRRIQAEIFGAQVPVEMLSPSKIGLFASARVKEERDDLQPRALFPDDNGEEETKSP